MDTLSCLCFSLIMGTCFVAEAQAAPLKDVSAMHAATDMGEVKATVLTLVRRDHPVTILLPNTVEQKTAVERAYPDGNIHNAMNVLLVQGKKYMVLVDTGLPDTLPALLERLREQNVTPEQITHVIITHAHRDHVGGLVSDGKAVFPRARLIFSEKEYDFWNDPANRALAPARAASIFEQWPQIQAPYAGRVETVKPAQEVLPGLRLIEAYGHTPGHVGVLLSSKDTSLLFWGDLLHAALVQIPAPDVAATYDLDPSAAIAARKDILRRAAQEHWLISGVHMPDAAIRTLP